MSTLLSSKTQSSVDTDTKVNPQKANFSKPDCYQADQQVKYLHLQAEIDVLLQELQILKQDKLTSETIQAD
jgi:hypothetical protein